MKRGVLRNLIFIILCVVVVFGITFYESEHQEPYLPIFVDLSDGTTTILPDEIPLAGDVSTKTTSKTSKKKTTKKEKMASVSQKSYTKKLPTKTDTTTKTTTKGNVTTKVVTKTTTATIERYEKGSNIKTITSNITIKVTTTVTTIKQLSGTKKAQTGSREEISVRSIAPKMDKRVLSAFESLGFAVAVDPTVNYTGCFDARAQKITMSSKDNIAVYHELGHFVGFVAGNVDRTREFNAVYQAEKGLYTTYNKAYVTQNPSEYFAESVKEYIQNGGALKQARPQTYNAIVSALNKITDGQVAKVKAVYSTVWDS